MCYLVNLQDKYILTSMAILCSVCVWHAVVPIMESYNNVTESADGWALIVLGSIYFLYHVTYFVYIYFFVRHLAVVFLILNNRCKMRLPTGKLPSDYMQLDSQLFR
jgi:hypothetical protein